MYGSSNGSSNTEKKSTNNLFSSEDQLFEEGREKAQESLYKETLTSTPFTIWGNKEGYWLGFGNWRLTELLPTPEDVSNKLWQEQWNIITNLIIAISDHVTTKNK